MNAMMTVRSLSVAAILGLAPTAALAQTHAATPTEAFVHGVTQVCARNAFGDLPLTPSPALDAAKVLLVDGGTDPDVRGAFHDMPVTIDYGAVPSASGQIIIGADEAGSCRVAAINVTPAVVAEIQAAFAANSDGWTPIANDPDKGETTYSGPIGDDTAMVAVLVPPAGSDWGKAGILFTVMNPAAGS
ncbi:MAG: hypothetical protein K2X25_14215 [Caulobacteraceae bacterium]|nr:hypothetical protein [Caulobacteraceae bacterium]